MNVLVTGSNRGIGLAWVRQFAGEGEHVYATCRRPDEADELQELATQYPSIAIRRLDITDAEDHAHLRKELANEPIDILLNNAGIYMEPYGAPLAQMDFSDWQRSFAVNVLGTLRVVRTFLDLVGRSERKLIIATSTRMGSISHINETGSYAYRSSKAALNAAMKSLSLEVRSQGIGVLILDPGPVRSRMGAPESPHSPDESVAYMRKLVDWFELEETGRFYRYNGEELSW